MWCPTLVHYKGCQFFVIINIIITINDDGVIGVSSGGGSSSVIF